MSENELRLLHVLFSLNKRLFLVNRFGGENIVELWSRRDLETEKVFVYAPKSCALVFDMISICKIKHDIETIITKACEMRAYVRWHLFVAEEYVG